VHTSLSSWPGQFSDVLFKLEDGTQGIHKPLLMARSVLDVLFKLEDWTQGAHKPLLMARSVLRRPFYAGGRDTGSTQASPHAF
jgi:hypothetical protein